MRLIFMGSPVFAVPTLEALTSRYPNLTAVTKPDRPAGRGKSLKSPPVKEYAEAKGIPVLQPSSLKGPLLKQLEDIDPDLIVVAAYGRILPPEVLELPRHGCINLHASLLPRWRGASPIQAAILHGDRETGVTVMKMDEGMDTGPILSRQSTPIREDETGGSLSKRLAPMGADLLVQTLPDYVEGKIVPQPQEGDEATYAPLLRKSDGKLDWTQTAERLERQIRAYHPWPGTFFYWEGSRVKVHKAEVQTATSIPIGEVRLTGGFPTIGTGGGGLTLLEIQPAGKVAMTGKAFLNGNEEFLQASLA